LFNNSNDEERRKRREGGEIFVKNQKKVKEKSTAAALGDKWRKVSFWEILKWFYRKFNLTLMPCGKVDSEREKLEDFVEFHGKI
jgi:hypothetical protein